MRSLVNIMQEAIGPRGYKPPRPKKETKLKELLNDDQLWNKMLSLIASSDAYVNERPRDIEKLLIELGEKIVMRYHDLDPIKSLKRK